MSNSQDNLLSKLDLDAIQTGGIVYADQMNKLIKFAGYVSLMKENDFDLNKVFPSTINDAARRQLVCDMYSIVFDLSELNEDDWRVLKAMELYILLPEKIGEITQSID